jgi:NADH-quinone oxidoreductase subunit H
MSNFVIFLIDATVKSILIIAGLVLGFAYATWLERRFIARIQVRLGPNRAGPFGLLQPWADALKLFFKEDLIPAQADKVVFTLAPAITAVPALIVLAVVPFGGQVNLFGHVTTLGLADVNVGVLYILAVTSIAVYGIVLAGWSSASKYAMMGGLRSSAQMISYEIAMGLAVLGPIMVVGSMSLADIIDAQQRLWMFFLQPVAGIIFMIAIVAETNRTPFDMPEAEQELVAGYHTEYSGMKFAAFFMAEYMKMIAVSVITAALFFGGYRLFGLENLLGGWMGPVILLGKVIVGLMIFIWLRATFPRIRYDRLMAFGWKVLVPIALVNTAVTAILVVLDVFPGFVTV